MLIIFHALIHVLFGTALALLWRSDVRPPTSWRLTAALYIDLLTAAPLAAYQVRLWPAYALGYAFDPLLTPELYQYVPLGTLGVLLAMPCSLFMGYTLATAAHRRGRTWLAGSFPVLALAAAAALGAMHYEEFTVVADFANYWRGGGTWAGSHLHVQMLLLVYALGLSALWPLSRTQRTGTP